MEFFQKGNISYIHFVTSQKGLRASRSHEKGVQIGYGRSCASSAGNSISPDERKDGGGVMNFSDIVLTALFLVPPVSDVANEGKSLSAAATNERPIL